MTDRQTADFGFRTVDREEKPSLVRGVFDSVAPKYDLMNDLMSGGVHRLWKADMVTNLAPRPGQHLLDVAGGTGDIARRFLKGLDGDGRVTIVDYTPRMLEVGRDRAIDAGIVEGIGWVAGDAARLPVADNSVDAYTIAFGIRNVTDIPGALREARRVVRPGGRFLCLEFSHVAVPGLDRLYEEFSFRLLPRLGGLVAGDRDSYQYLVESIRRFPDQETFATMIREAGLSRVSYRNLSGGIAALHSAWVV
ncbi:Ubiquinone/menaquinone biosynthesis C-methyltransferase UbiE [Oceanibacterium hippocampi]|uniref:Ubiquinone/menaquinone biosynthesis C-methyltransferase UbiE n=1 Tax=Oceanibacterium hippocampi TaxID=745714 RepID=A0A1Y5RSM7_9PROT|nr:class I SAM-dependent methyltransferase [Oceanibacterium hippocampi]SLN21744.1 Ubiquinone/menaquinone biosynthesis C-methyltransferase UbiE [Oceanibacterium hippocampi]